MPWNKQMTDEEMLSQVLPQKYRCKGCEAVAFQFDMAFKVLPKRKLAQHEYAEALDCREDNFQEYGEKEFGKDDSGRDQWVLFGPGLPEPPDQGLSRKGGEWPVRLRRLCAEIVGEFEEESQLYKSWTEHDGYHKFAEDICRPYCGGLPRGNETKEEEEKPSKRKRRKASSKKHLEDNMPKGPSKVASISDRKEIIKVMKTYRFVVLLFCDDVHDKCVRLVKQFEIAAQTASKESSMKKVLFAMADTTKVGSLGIPLHGNILPAFLLFREGYAAPKQVHSQDMLLLREAGDILNWIQGELRLYMQDDPVQFPRGKMEL
jgi:hypothetical protein